MNKEYAYLNGKILIIDELCNKRIVEYSNNIEEILVQENLVEYIEKALNLLYSEKSDNKFIQSKFYTVFKWFPVLLCSLGGYFVKNGLSDSVENTEKTLFGISSAANEMSLIVTAIITLYAYTMCFMINDSDKEFIKKQKGISSQIEFLNRTLIEEKENLIALQQQRKLEQVDNKEYEFQSVQVDDGKILNSLKQLLELYYDCGYNGKKYYKYYLDGKLLKKLKKKYTESEIDMIEEFLEEKGPQLLKKKNIK